MKTFAILSLFVLGTSFFNNLAIINASILLSEDIDATKQSFTPPIDGVPLGFENVLSKDVIQQLRDLHDNQKLTFEQKRIEFDRIMNTVPSEILVKLPLPPGLDSFPPTVQTQIETLHNNSSLSWIEKHQQIGKLIDSLPENQRPQFAPHKRLSFPSAPPPGFEKVLPATVYKQLLEIHQNESLSPKEKMQLIDNIMREQQQSILDKLPLPPGFDRLPTALYEEAHAIFANKNMTYEENNKAIIRFIKKLPKELRPLVRPPLSPALQQIPKKTQDEIEEVSLDENLNNDERDAAFWKVIDQLPSIQRNNVHRELGKVSSFEYNDDSSGSAHS